MSSAPSFAARLWRSPDGRLGLLGALALAVAAVVLPPLLADPIAQPDLLTGTLRPPSREHLLGTDALSRDVLSRLMHALGRSLLVGVGAVALGTTIALVVGFAAGLGPRWLDAALMRTTDAILTLPRLLLLLVALGASERIGPAELALWLGLTGWPMKARLLRGEVQRLVHEPFVVGAVALGVGSWRLTTHLLLPHAAAPVLAAAAVGLGEAVLAEAGLGFLGLGAPPPTPTLGGMVAEARPVLLEAPWLAVAPGALLVAVGTCAFVLADAAQRAADPRRP